MSVMLLPAKAATARDQILALIRKGSVRPGQRLPSERDLASQLGMDQRTVRRGLADLNANGWVVKRPRLGNYVKDVTPEPQTTHVALILPQWLTGQERRHPIIGTLWNGVATVFDQRNINTHLHLLDYHHKGDLWAEAGQIAAKRGVRGAVVFSHPQLTCKQVRPLLDAGIKVVTMMDRGRGLDLLGVPLVTVDVESILRRAVYRLAELGHQRICIVGYRDEDPRDFSILQRICNEAGLDFEADAWIRSPNPKPRLDTTLIAEALSRTPRPTAMVAYDEVLAAGVFRACYEMRIRIPEELSLVSIFDHTPHAYPVHLSAPDTKSMISRVAQKASRMLQDMMAGEEVDELAVTIGGDIQWQESVAAPGGTETG